MRELLCSKLVLLGVIGTVACSLSLLAADARHAYDSSGSASQSSTSNPYAINQFSPPGSTVQNTIPQHTTSQNKYAPQSQYTPPQNQYTQQQQGNSYPQTTRNNGTNFYGISPAQLSGGAVVHGNTFPANGGVGRGGYDERWNPNFGTGAGAQTMAREAGGLAQSLRDNFPLPMSGDEALMFQVNDFAARSNGGMQSRRP